MHENSLLHLVLYFWGDKMGSTHKALLLYTKVWWLSQRDHLYDYLSCEPNYSLCLWNSTFTWKNNWQTRYLDLGIWQTFSLQWREKVNSGKTTDSCCCQGQASSFQLKIKILENVFTVSLTTFQYIKIFLMRSVVIITNGTSSNCIMKCVTMWNICITQQTSIPKYIMQ